MANSDWRNIDPATLNEQLRDRYENMKAIYRRYKEARGEFEGEMQKAFAQHLTDTTELKFGYNFGKLSIAVGPKHERKAKTAKDNGSLGDWLADQALSGRNA